MSGKKKIIVVGFPKSGNTWLTRLTAELVHCPAKGFLYHENKPDVCIEGLERVSDYDCFKSHHQYHELLNEDQVRSKIIYVLRDPRDVVLSGTSYFNPIKVYHFKNLDLRQLVDIINYIYRKVLGERLMKKKMINAVLNGDSSVHHWCRVSWKKHMLPYIMKTHVLVVKYEDLLEDPFKESKRIVEFIGLKKDVDEIEKAIENQSFEVIKAKFRTRQQKSKFNFLRKGSANQWRRRLSKKEKKVFLQKLGAEIRALMYKPV